MTVMAYIPDFQVAWSSTRQEDERFARIIKQALLAFLVVAVAMPWLPVAEITRDEKEKLPPQLARVILEKQELLKPQPKPLPKPKPKVVKSKPKPKPKPKERPKPRPVDLLKQAREKAAVAGVLAFQDDLADMRDVIQVAKVTRSDLTRGSAKAEKFERSVISSNVKADSGGIRAANLSRDTGGVALSGRKTTKISSSIGGKAGHAVKAGSSASAPVGGRSDEEIRRVMDTNKGAIFSIYNRALRRDPALQGKFVFEMVIEPNGAISGLNLLSSELGDDKLAAKILARIRMIRFGAAAVLKTRVNYSFDFLPY